MKLIIEMIEDLKLYSTAFNNGEMDKETLNLQLILMKDAVQALEIDFNNHPLDGLDERVKDVFNQLLQRHKSKAVIYLDLMIKADDKRRYNKLARCVISSNFFFVPFSHTMKRNIEAYKVRNELQQVKDFQILVVKKAVSNG